MRAETVEENLVSVIIPTLNSARHLKATIDSVLAQTYRPIEIIVVDGKSTDGTQDIARSFPSIRLIEEKEPVSIANGRNVGIECAHGRFIAIVSSDDLWEPNKIEMQVNALLENPGAMYCVCRLRHFLSPGESVPKGFREVLFEEDVVGHMPETLLARIELFSQIGMFEPGYGVAEDLEWFQRARDLNVPMTVVPETLLRKRIHSASLSMQRERVLQDTIGLFRRRVQKIRLNKAESGQ